MQAARNAAGDRRTPHPCRSWCRPAIRERPINRRHVNTKQTAANTYLGVAAVRNRHHVPGCTPRVIFRALVETMVHRIPAEDMIVDEVTGVVIPVAVEVDPVLGLAEDLSRRSHQVDEDLCVKTVQTQSKTSRKPVETRTVFMPTHLAGSKNRRRNRRQNGVYDGSRGFAGRSYTTYSAISR